MEIKEISRKMVGDMLVIEYRVLPPKDSFCSMVIGGDFLRFAQFKFAIHQPKPEEGQAKTE